MSRLTGPGVPPMMADARAKCHGVDGDVFYPERYNDTTTAEAKAVCEGCLIRADCLLWALRYEPDGVYAGYTPAERAAMGGVYNGHANIKVAA